jgi:hypothetical protein
MIRKGILYGRTEVIAMALRGHIENGAIVLDEQVSLPEGAAVEVLIVAPPAPPTSEAELPTVAETLKDFIGCLEDLPDDAASNHDHYLYGTSKKP